MLLIIIIISESIVVTLTTPCASEGTLAMLLIITLIFRVDSIDSDYTLWVGGYSGNASDSLSVHNGHQFSTYDRLIIT